ncbi:hypothetical protein [Blastopirellula marina]|uniref:YcxB-like protein domain-containing protein n=1 Tax=Blastopirellula marina TaxID=124 RepID=A0A2S8FP00_9BACT|nr:hypothetical protein [Blastopirellula marina]PQO33908.1 hypothetical protein C5Y98_16945 [Blastopirellula marina]PTL43695.1 hypothetical protein C5Y97_16955 [Blastopirellula marina]
MVESNENPFASPVDVSRSGHQVFQATDREIAAKENFQAAIAAALSILLGLATVQFVVLVGLFSFGGAAFTLVIMIFMTLSCIATTINHWHRAKRAQERFPLVIDEEGIQAKFDNGGAWLQQTISWKEIASVRFEPRDRMVITTTSGQASIADLRLLGGRRWRPLKETLTYYSDWMAEQGE